VEAGKKILGASDVKIIAADDLDDAATKAVAAIRESEHHALPSTLWGRRASPATSQQHAAGPATLLLCHQSQCERRINIAGEAAQVAKDSGPHPP